MYSRPLEIKNSAKELFMNLLQHVIGAIPVLVLPIICSPMPARAARE